MTDERRWLREQLVLYRQLLPELQRLWTFVPGEDAAALQHRSRRRRELNRLLSAADPRALRAIYLARQETLREPGGEDKLRLEELVSFSRAYTLTGAALVLHCHPNTAGNWHRQFLEKVRKYLK